MDEKNPTASRPVVQPQPSQTLTPAQAREKNEKTVTMVFPRRCLLAVSHSEKIEFKEGVNEVPAHLVDHPYLKAHGVTLYDPKRAPEKVWLGRKPKKDIKVEEVHLAFVQERGYTEIKNLDQLKEFLEGMSDEHVASFFKDFEMEQKAKADAKSEEPEGVPDGDPDDEDSANEGDANEANEEPVTDVSKDNVTPPTPVNTPRQSQRQRRSR